MAVIIGEKTLELPVIQGGMGVGVSLDRLAGAVASCGGMGTISAALPGLHEPDFEADPKGASLRALGRQVRSAKEAANGKGLVAVNVMVAARAYADLVKTAISAGADAIVCGAGLALDLPLIAEQAPENHALLAPIVSGGRAAALIARVWARRGRTPDFVVLEGPMAGGHLGFSHQEAQLAQEGHARPMKELLCEVLEALEPFRRKCSRDIPVFVAGGIRDGREMAEYMKQGAAGAQFATRFITTRECDASDGYKQALLSAKKEWITIVKSPVGMPGRALLSPLIQRVLDGTQQKPPSCMRCIVPCDPAEAPYCISRALIAAARGDWENGLFFCGANAGGRSGITTVEQEIEQIMREWREAQ